MKKTLAVIIIAAFAAFAWMAAAEAAQTRQVGILDSISFDGVDLDYSYLTYSNCPASAHSASIEFVPEYKSHRGMQKVVSFTVNIYDVVDSCGGNEQSTIVRQRVELYELLKKELKAQIDEGYVIDPDYVLWLPAVRTSPSGETVDTLDTAPAAQPQPAQSAPAEQTVQQDPAEDTVRVAVKQLTPQWHCYLQKKDGARNDGFHGYGNTLEDARSDSAAGCFSTNNPHCTTYSRHPDHTVCDVEFKDTGEVKIVEYTREEMQKNLNVERWECMLRKNDGSRNDGFGGRGATEMEARRDTVPGCERTNNPHCNTYAMDDDHTKCVAYASAAGAAAPQVRWTCTLWKNDGSRNDGFEGVGATENEARQDTISGCLRTNNPYCQEYSRDPEHTKCTAEIVQ